MVLSQPPISTTASSGSALTISSTSIAIRLRSSIEVGYENASCSDTVGNTKGSAPAMRTPRETASANPWSAISSTKGSVAFVSAFVEVIGTPPGMFATQ